MHYRADIDGLRTVAVVPVVLFHAGLTLFGGGFVGVDVFFVISGFLITSLIASEIGERKFSIATFYQRRIRRIFPALFVVMACTAIAGFLVMAPNDFRNLGKSIVATVFFVSNMYFWRQTGYFATPANEQPLLHTWSLSIEEQFYMFFPLLLVFLSRFSPKVRVWAFAILGIVSFAGGAAMLPYAPSAAFFLGPVRAWELLVGSLIALGAVPPSRNPAITLPAAVTGLALILAPIFFYDHTMPFPGFAALPPVIGTGLMIWSGLEARTSVHALLSTRPFVEIGKASYSLYLWHFPVLAVAHYLVLGELGPVAIVGACLASLVLAFLSLWFVERPFRFPSRPSNVRWAVAVSVAGMAAVAVAGILITVGNGFPGHVNAASMRYLDAENDKDRHHMECLSVEQRIVMPQQACRLGAKNVTPHVLLWGDSHSVVTATALEQAALRNNASFLFASSVDCPITLGVAIARSATAAFVNTPGYQYCEQYNNEMLKLATSDPNITTVVLSSRWTNWRIGEPGSLAEPKVDIRLRDSTGVAASMADNKEIFARGFERLLNALEKSGKKVWIVGPLPIPAVRVPKAAYVKTFGWDRSEIDIPLKDFASRNQTIMGLLDRAGKSHALNFIWPHTALCGAEKCPVTEDGEALYFDHNHLSIAGARKTSSLYDLIFSDALHESRSNQPRQN